MLKFKDVSKFYYNKGIISTGFSKVNLKLDLGEFVVITGESGSGKSTLLNVLSGMDTYEEGEMYIDGQETSHYQETEFEDYRKKYVSNIFQNFNLVNSYTVYQNVELVLLINGYKKKEVKGKILKILKDVGLLKFKNTKASKLSGGQKQRVAIARALAKETPIIIADEPTGNLDTASAKAVFELLNKVAKDKLVVIVTHNYDQVEKYATRKIKMHDGKIVEDKKLTNENEKINPAVPNYKDISFLNKIRLGFRNTFNIIPKFLLLLVVFIFMISGFLFEYSGFKKLEHTSSMFGYNPYFTNDSKKRIIVKKEDGSFFNESEYEKIEKIKNVDYIIKEDKLLDNDLSLVNNDMYLYGNGRSLKEMDGTVDLGRMPEAPYEVVLYGKVDDYYIQNRSEDILSSTYSVYIRNNFDNSVEYKIVGIKYDKTTSGSYNYIFYLEDVMFDKVKLLTEVSFGDFTTIINDQKFDKYSMYTSLTPNDKVSEGHIIINRDLNYACKNYNCLNKEIKIENKNLYYEKDITLKVEATYIKSNFKSLTGLSDFDQNSNSMFINTNDYKKLFASEYYQSSVFVKDELDIYEVEEELTNLGYKTLVIKDALYRVDAEMSQIIKIINLVVTIIFIIVMFFISYFIIRIILKSRNVYFSIMRILGMRKRVSKQILDIELLTLANLAYGIVVLIIHLVKTEIITSEFILSLSSFITKKDYILIYVIIIIMTQLISNKFAKSLFKKSAIKTMNEVI